MKNKKVIVMTTLLMAVVLLSIGTIAYFRRIVNGNVSASVGDLVLVVNEANAELNETFSVSLNRSEEEPFVLPDDKGTFNINIDSTGSGSDVYVTINIIRTNLPNNLKFYLDENYTNVLTSKTYTIAKSNSMTLSVPVYWFWDGSVDDENDSLFINEALEARVSVTATTGLHTLYDTIVVNPTLDTDVNFNNGSSISNGNGLMLMNSTQNDEYPIVYYRGDVTNNNVIFADLCWSIVRTTETGGIKLVFNGPVNKDNGCTKYYGLDDRYMGEVFVNGEAILFNTRHDSPVYVGYMYNDDNRFFNGSNPNYNMTQSDVEGYISHLANATIDSETGRHVQNLKDSNAKIIIDGWYESNLLGTEAESLLEDTIWCNDRSVTSETYSIENYATNSKFCFSAWTRLYENTTVTPSLACTRDMDKFTVDSANGNGDLNYPIGLLTADELSLSGFAYSTSSSVWIYLNSTFFTNRCTLSPALISNGYSRISMTANRIYYVGINNHCGLVPAVSLKNTTLISSGNGSYKQPYIVVTP